MKRRFLSTTPSLLEEPGINLTPLIDVVFVLLMAFMIIMPLITLDKISLADSQKEITGDNPEQTLVIKVFADNRIQVNNQNVSINQLTEYLSQKKINCPDMIPLLLQDGNSSFHAYQKVKESAEKAGFTSLHIALNPA